MSNQGVENTNRLTEYSEHEMGVDTISRSDDLKERMRLENLQPYGVQTTAVRANIWRFSACFRELDST